MRVILIVALAGALAACGAGGSRLNPLNWFGGAEPAPVVARSDAAPAVPLAAQVIALDAAPTPGGAIVSAIALPPTQGFWDAELVRLPSDDPSVYLMEFRLRPPLETRRAGTQPSREVLGGTFLTRQELAGIASISVQGASNRLVVRRR